MVDMNEFDDFDTDDEAYESALQGGLVPAPGAKKSKNGESSWPEIVTLKTIEFKDWEGGANAEPNDKTLRIDTMWTVAEISTHDGEVSPNVGEAFFIRHFVNFTAGHERKGCGHGKMFKSIDRFWGNLAQAVGVENDYNGNLMKLIDLHKDELRGAPFTGVLRQKFTDFGPEIEIRAFIPLEEAEDE